MGVDPGVLDRLMKVLFRFADTNEGTRQAAYHGFAGAVASEGIDIRDLRLTVNGNGSTAAVDGELERRWAEYKEIRRRAYPEESKLQDEIDRLRILVNDLEGKVAQHNRMSSQLMAAQREHADAVKARSEARAILATKMDTHPLLTLLKTSLVRLANDDYKAAMSKTEFREKITEAGRDYDEFIRILGWEEPDTLQPWLRATVRTLLPPPAPKRKARKKAT